MNRPKSKSGPKGSAATLSEEEKHAMNAASRGTRETIESIVIAVILAFLFRAFEAEAFVIPTGSMAPTLQGRHVDVDCEQCGHRYQTGASCENNESQSPGFVTGSYCPICRFPMMLKRRYPEDLRRIADIEPPSELDSNQESFMGDRIIVCKFVYDLSDPKRWDVIVFKFPENAKQNYIKRLIGLPSETIMIKNGDIYTKRSGEDKFTIARKENPAKLRSMLQLVGDTDHIAKLLHDLEWPSRWQQWSENENSRAWKVEYEDRPTGYRQRFQTDGSATKTAWLRYRHLVPRWEFEDPRNEPDDWFYLLNDELPPDILERRGQLISDFYTYNFRDQIGGSGYGEGNYAGAHWVGDLAVECNIEIESTEGQLALDLVEGGVHYTCKINVADGTAQLSINDGRGNFDDGQTLRSAATKLNGKGNYELRFSNIDDQLRLWIDEHVIKFDGPTSYVPIEVPVPKWSEDDPGDAEPVGIGSQGVAIKVNRLRVLRDVYYTATDRSTNNDYLGYSGDYSTSRIREVLENPASWASHELFQLRQPKQFPALEEGQFLPMGDNSPSSSDGRYWTEQHYVDRKLLTGKALFIYWPHSWNAPVQFAPNFGRMRFIR